MPTNIECVRSIDAQGLMGQITTMDVGRVAKATVDAALTGKAVIIPGMVNRFMQMVGGFIPARALARLIGKRWISARKRRNQEDDHPGFRPVEVM